MRCSTQTGRTNPVFLSPAFALSLKLDDPRLDDLATGTAALQPRSCTGDGSGRYVSVIGRNALFHNPEDRGPQVVDARAIASFVDAFAIVAKTLAGR